ncbi:MAG: phage tail length tape measure family protein, partial [bacterium]
MTQIPVAGLHAELALGTAKMQSGVGDAERLLTRLQEKMTGTGRKAKRAGDEIDTGVGKGLKGAAASASAFERRMDFLQKRFDPLYAASKRYEAELRLLDEAHKRGAISSATYTRNLDRLNAELAGVDTGVAGATAQMGRFNGVAKGMSAQTGNIAAQFQDIGVQLAGGQSPFLIALQQGTQLTGVFNQMGGGIRQVGPALIGAFSSLLNPLSLATIGVIAFGGAIFQWFTGSEEKAKSLEEAVGDVSSAVSDLQRITDLLDQTDLTGIREQFGGLSADVVELLTLQRELAVMDAMRGISDAITAARNSMDGWITSGLDGIKAAFDTTIDRAREIQMLMDEVAAATTPQEALDRTIALRQTIEEVAGPLNTLSDSAFEMLKALAEGESALRQVVVQAERSETALGSARVEAERLAVAAPGAGWMGTAIKETNLLIGRLIEARAQRDAMLSAASSANYDALLANTGQSSGPDSVRSRLGGGGAFAPRVRGAG